MIGLMRPSTSHTISALALPQPSLFDHYQNAAYPKAEASLKAAGILPEAVELTSASRTYIISSSKITASSNGASSQGWASFRSRARGERGPGYQVMHLIRKGQRRGVEKGDILGQVACLARLFGVAASAEQEGTITPIVFPLCP